MSGISRGKETREVIAEQVGFDSYKTYERAKAVVEKGAPELIEAMDAGRIAVSVAAKFTKELSKGEQAKIAVASLAAPKKTIKAIVKEQKETARRQEASTIAAKLPDIGKRYRFFTCDLLDAKIEAESVDWIITDPPYPEKFLPVYEKLSAFGARVLKPGGGLVCMVGQSYLPEIIAHLGRHLRYHWTLAYLTPGGQSSQLWERKVNTFWKPLLWFVKGEYAGKWIGDVCKSETKR